MPLARTSEIVVLELPDETLVYDTRVTQAHCLNETAAFVWRHCDGRNTATDISRLVSDHFKTSVDADFVWLALDQLQERGLLADRIPDRKHLSSRRELIRKVGIASIIAVPIIASLVAPPSAFAAASCACVNPGACLTQTSCPNTNNCNGSGICAP